MLGFLATVALLGSGAAIAYMVMPQEDDGATARAPEAAKPKAKAKPALTKAQRRARAAAVAVLAKDGYEPARLADWRPKAELKVLVGRNDQGAMRAFFFTDGEFLGHDDASSSNSVRVGKRENGAVTLSYRVSTGGRESVRFSLEDGALAHTDPLPPSTVR